MKLSEIVWPVYSLGSNCPSREGSLLYFSRKEKDGISLKVVDDAGVPGDSLSARRIYLMAEGVKLYRIKYALFYLADLVKLAKPTTWFIDASGKLFQYKKVSTAKLVFKKITNIIRGIGHTIIEVEGCSNRFSCLYPPTLEEKYAGLLIVQGSYIFYGFFKEKHKSTYRKI